MAGIAELYKLTPSELRMLIAQYEKFALLLCEGFRARFRSKSLD